MRFLIDRCAGTLIAQWLHAQGHDVVEAHDRGPDPGDHILLAWAVQESRILITIDTDFGHLVFVESLPHSGLVRLPDARRDCCRRRNGEVAVAAFMGMRGIAEYG